MSREPEDIASGSVFEALVHLQQRLGPLIDGLRQDPTARSYVDTVHAENARLRGEISRLKERAGLQACPPPGVVDVSGVVLALGPMATSESKELLASPSLKLAGVDDREPDASSVRSRKVSSAASTPSSRVRKVSSSSSASSAVPMLVGSPERAFVINMRRLIDSEETLRIIHELLTSTAIAALTLVQAGSVEQLRSTVWFLGFTIPIFMLHMRQWDMLDISDITSLLPLLSDDDDLERGVSNPNRLLKGLSFTSSWLTRLTRSFFHVAYTFVICFMIVLSDRSLNPDTSPAASEAEPDLIGDALRFFASSEEDAAVLNLQVFVGALMIGLHGLFGLYFYRETCGVMPRTRSDAVWDPRTDGLPLRFKLLGLPSMWFTSQEALDDLKRWIDAAVPTSRVLSIYPQEMAYYALAGGEERSSVESALKHSKLFDGRRRKFIGGGGEPEALNIELCFFDEALQNPACPHPGEFLLMREDDGTPGASMRPRDTLCGVPARSLADGVAA